MGDALGPMVSPEVGDELGVEVGDALGLVVGSNILLHVPALDHASLQTSVTSGS